MLSYSALSCSKPIQELELINKQDKSKTKKEIDNKVTYLFFLKLSLASSYFPVGLPLKYLHRDSVSQLSSGWVRVVPPHHRHQANLSGLLDKNPESCTVIVISMICRFNCGILRTSPRSISTSWLRMLPHLHLKPIKQVIYL